MFKKNKKKYPYIFSKEFNISTLTQFFEVYLIKIIFNLILIIKGKISIGIEISLYSLRIRFYF